MTAHPNQVGCFHKTEIFQVFATAWERDMLLLTNKPTLHSYHFKNPMHLFQCTMSAWTRHIQGRDLSISVHIALVIRIIIATRTENTGMAHSRSKGFLAPLQHRFCHRNYWHVPLSLFNNWRPPCSPYENTKQNIRYYIRYNSVYTSVLLSLTCFIV